MPRGRRKAELILSADESQTLKTWAGRPKSTQQLAQRARIVLACALVMDNYGTHKAPAVKRWFLRHPEYHLHFTPTSGSWLNMVERFFAEITEKRIRRGAFRSVAGASDQGIPGRSQPQSSALCVDGGRRPDPGTG